MSTNVNKRKAETKQNSDPAAGDLLETLRSKWAPALERCGLVLDDGTVLEMPNRAAEIADNFKMEERDYAPYKNRIAASWHTHTHESANLSAQDYAMFLAFPGWFHYIVSSTDVWVFYVRNGRVMLYE